MRASNVLSDLKIEASIKKISVRDILKTRFSPQTLKKWFMELKETDPLEYYSWKASRFGRRGDDENYINLDYRGYTFHIIRMVSVSRYYSATNAIVDMEVKDGVNRPHRPPTFTFQVEIHKPKKDGGVEVVFYGYIESPEWKVKASTLDKFLVASKIV